SEPAWPLNNLVGANSPSLCPTISSVTNTGTCLRPSCTANVCPTNEGNMVERLDQVLTTCFLSLRSEEHTSELQSRFDLVCRLLLLPSSPLFPYTTLFRSSEPAWPLNNLVGANSPSLCPTISSVTNTGTCLRPSCTANVCPTNEGNMVERLDQVLTTCFLSL